MEVTESIVSDAEKVNVEIRSSGRVEPDASANADDFVVDFSEGDPTNPINWTAWRKWTIVALVSIMSLLDSFATLTIIPAAPQIATAFTTTTMTATDHTANLYTTLLVSIWELGEGIGPFLVAPLSERYGRLPVYHTGNVLFILCSVACALSTNIAMFVAFRFLNGLVIVSLTLGPSIVGDLFVQEERGLAMAMATVMPVLGPVGAPIVGAFVAQGAGWRWTIWLVVIAVGLVTVLSLGVFRETYAVRILERMGKRLRRETGDERWQVMTMEHSSSVVTAGRKTPLSSTFLHSMTRPIQMMIFEPVVLIISLYTAVTYGLSYLVLTTLTEIMETTYGFSQGLVGLTFLGPATGNLLALVLYAATSDRYLKHKTATTGRPLPSHRLPFMLLGALTLPLGFLLYGWTASSPNHIHWIFPLLGTSLIGFSVVLTILPTENYLVDAFGRHSASAVAAGVICRALVGAGLPLVGPVLYERLGLGWGNTVLGGVGVVFVPVLVMLMRYGEKWRGKGRFDGLDTQH